jgi:putative Ig domain-containing protein
VLALDPISGQTVAEGSELRLTITATNRTTDAALTYDLEDPPMGATIDSATGVFSWTPTEAQGPSTNDITVVVTSDGLEDRRTFVVTVSEVNRAPVLSPIPNQLVRPGTLVSVTAAATDADVPANVLTFSLASGAPAGAAIDPASGLFIWLTTNVQVGTSHTITVQATDNGSPSLSDTKTFTVELVSTLTASVASEASNVTLTWAAIPGKPCKIQFRDDLTQGDWQDLGESMQATSSRMTKSLPIHSATQRFYRVVEGP